MSVYQNISVYIVLAAVCVAISQTLA